MLLGSLVCVVPAAAQTPGAPAPSPAPAWRKIYENSQETYYVDAGARQPSGKFNLTSLIAYKIPQVVNGAQVWSVIARMQLSCDQKQMVTTENTLYALKMGAGPVVESQPVNDSWHQPQPDSLGGLIWSTACGKP